MSEVLIQGLILGAFAGWLIRGCWVAWTNRKEIAAKDVPGVIIFGGGGPLPQK